MKSHLILRTSLIFAAITLAADAAFGCSCGPKPPVLDAYEHAQAVVIARIVSVSIDKSMLRRQREANNEEDLVGVGPATFLIEKVYKGRLPVNGEITVGTGPNAACIWSFLEQSVGKQFLLYLRGVDGTGTVWGASTCGRTRGLDYAAEDLLFLDNMEKHRGKTRVSGTYHATLGATLEDVANRRILIKGEKKTYETKTDAKGVFEIYDLPPGNYLLVPEIPNGWQIPSYVLMYSKEPPPTGPLKSLPFTLEAKKHATIDLPFVPSNAIEGSVVGPDGNPMKGICVRLLKPDQVEGNSGFACTNKDGEFRIRSVPVGSYIAVLNPDGKLSPDEPFAKMFYPSVAQREKAALITIGDGQSVKGINFVVSSVAQTVTVSGVLLFSDGKPAAEELVTFLPLNKDDFYGDHAETTDAEGRFTVRILKGVKGQIFGDFQAALGEFEKCPKLDALIKASGRDFAEIKSPAIKVEAEHDVENLVLQFSFPRCKKKE
ncbi:MAG TPA: hypothetical protein VJ656_10085 [Pyrinomonadaceae bacterium]|nr:hypothetical protein [Pyrinomonadaceae bacterium]